jgi:hypothetical protein
VARVRSWAEEVRVAEVDRALRRLPGLGVEDKGVLESLSKKLVGELLAPSTGFAAQTSKTLSNSKRLPILCDMFGRREAACPGSYCSAFASPPGDPSAHLCAVTTTASNQRRSQAP